MPPKGKGKKSKKQLEEEKRIAEEERRAAEELARKLAEEEAERKRIEEEKRKAEEEQRRQEELKRLAEESPEEQQRVITMDENAKLAAQARIQDLDEKTKACDPLPDVDRETDLNSFITQWKETKMQSLGEAIEYAQTSENVIRSLQDKRGEALAMYDQEKLRWCHDYMDKLRGIELAKFDEVSAHILEYMDLHTKLTEEEIQKNKENAGKRGTKGDVTRKDTVSMVEQRQDVLWGLWANVISKNRAHTDIEFGPYIGQLPIKQANNPIILRCMWTSYDYLTPYKIQDDLVIGGVLNFQLFKFPEFSKQASKWTMRYLLPIDKRLEQIYFPDPTATVQSDMPVELKFKMPKNVYMSNDDSEVKIAVWDKEKEIWTTDCLQEVAQFNKETRQIKLMTMKFAPMAMLQSRCTDYPFVDWKLRCVSEDVAMLDLKTKRLNLVFEISPLQLKLVKCQEPALAHLNDQEGMSPGYLLQELAKCGIHLMPRDEDFRLAGLEPKDRAAEERAIIDVSLAVRAFHFQTCKWNQVRDANNPGVSSENVLLRIRENLEFDDEFLEDSEPDWRYVMWWNNKVAFVQGCKNSQDSNCNAQIADGHVTHAMLSQACEMPHCSESAYTICKDLTFIEFTETVKKTLRLLRLFSFS